MTGYIMNQVKFNPLTQTYDTADGTQVAVELTDNVQSLADVLYIAIIRDKQRRERKKNNERGC